MNESRSLLGRLGGWIWGLVSGLYKLLVVLSTIVVIGLLWLAFRGGTPVKVEDNVALVIAPTGALVEQLDHEPGRAFLENIAGDQPSQTLLRDLIEALEEGARDSRIRFAVLKLDGLTSASLPQLEELGDAVQDFRQAGKKVIAYGPWYEQDEYYLAAQADEVVLDPMGMVNIEGFSAYNNYFKDALDKLGVQVNVFRVGEYKSAVEPFIRNDMSPEAKAADRVWLGNLWSDYGETVSEARQLPETAVTDYVDSFAAGMKKYDGDAAAYAKNAGLVTSVETLSQFRKRMGAIVGIDPDHGSFRQINERDYLRAVRHERSKKKKQDKDEIALVVVQGEIVDGDGRPGEAGGDTIADLLDQARRDDDVAGVVLRVDSPGGSVWASEQIRREVQALREAGKPVVASMSSVAASGGYWVSMAADQIWAHNSTITGSIGIFGLIPTIDKPLEKLGVHTDGVGTTTLAGGFRIDRPLSPEAAVIIQSQINKGYRDFIGGVAQARKLTVAKVDEIARGRVWSGGDAQDLGLVDELGGLQDAADAAAKLAGLGPDDYELQEMEPDHPFSAKFLSDFYGHVGLSAVPGVPQWAHRLLARMDVVGQLDWLNDPRGMYAYCFCTPSNTRR
ncbi:MAG: signal peptide peptidase SppA [Nevskiaceae bacterium]|nr:MAG: signal peptide peptidase SppA [Nevskiaceae bacterium]